MSMGLKTIDPTVPRRGRTTLGTALSHEWTKEPRVQQKGKTAGPASEPAVLAGVIHASITRARSTQVLVALSLTSCGRIPGQPHSADEETEPRAAPAWSERQGQPSARHRPPGPTGQCPSASLAPEGLSPGAVGAC